MSVTAWLQSKWADLAWAVFALINLIAMLLTPDWETIPFHFIWVSLTLLYGFRVWGLKSTSLILGVVAAGTGVVILNDAFDGSQLWGELFEVPLMSGMFLAMVWHARRRQVALKETERVAAERASLLEHQERLLHDVSHELRTPVTIARGHLETLMLANNGQTPQEIAVAVDELDRIAYIVDRLLLLAKAERPDFVAVSEVDLEPFLEDVFVRWSDVAARNWRLGAVASGTLMADPHALRIALDALVDNAVAHTTVANTIELFARASGRFVELCVRDDGPGIPPEAIGRIFERFARADSARSRQHGGVGLGLSIVDAIARAHHGRCTVTSAGQGAMFCLTLPGFIGAQPNMEAAGARMVRLPLA